MKKCCDCDNDMFFQWYDYYALLQRMSKVLLYCAKYHINIGSIGPLIETEWIRYKRERKLEGHTWI